MPPGAKLRGGRWNSPGQAVLYASSTLALACLEVLVHIRDIALLPADYVFCEVEVPAGSVGPWELTGEAALARIESPVLSREFGDAWLRYGGRTPLTAYEYKPVPQGSLIERRTRELVRSFPVQTVPSVIVPREMNYRINPEHPEFDALMWGQPAPFRFDPRLIGPTSG